MAAQVLEAGVQPLTEWLGKETPKVTAWLNGVKTRFGQMGSSLGADWKSGNMGAFGQDLDTILGGGGEYAGDLESLGKAVKGFVDITKNDLIPFGKDLLWVAIPALKGLADVLAFLGDHRGTVQALLITFGGFLAVSNLRWSSPTWPAASARCVGRSAKAFPARPALNFLRGMLGLEAIAGPGGAIGGALGGGGKRSGASLLGTVGASIGLSSSTSAITTRGLLEEHRGGRTHRRQHRLHDRPRCGHNLSAGRSAGRPAPSPLRSSATSCTRTRATRTLAPVAVALTRSRTISMSTGPATPP